MFDQLVVSATIRKKSARCLYFTATAAAWMTALTATIVAGIFAFDARLDSDLKAMTPVALPIVSRYGEREQKPDQGKRPQQDYVSARTPPKEIVKPSTSPSPPDLSTPVDFTGSGDKGGPVGDPYGVKDGHPDGVRDGILHGTTTAAPPPPPPAETRKPQPEPTPVTKPPDVVRKTSVILQGSAIRRVEPTYPSFAISARITGQVVVEVTVDEAGNVTQARALSGHALLRKVSVDAAYGWKWRPTLLNNVPVKVIGTITFNFKL
ncbi:MAG TPA: energy transducer TonB [Blastocatellia bacterium]|nr:energy transducer TonB [Blastocatellia bacterium]